MSSLENIILGIITGVLTSAILFCISILIKSHLYPWYQKITYKGLDISGEWLATVDGQNAIKGRFNLNLTQNAHELGGTLHIVQGKDLSNPTLSNSLLISGTIWEGFVTLNFQSIDRKRLSYATSLLRTVNGGARLDGFYLYRSIQDDLINSSELKFNRA